MIGLLSRTRTNTKHADRDACEISVSVHVSTNLEGKDADWAFSDQDTRYLHR